MKKNEDTHVSVERFSDDAHAERIMAEHPSAVMHSGGSTGGTAMMILCRDHGRAVAVVKNVDSEEIVPLRSRLF